MRYIVLLMAMGILASCSDKEDTSITEEPVQSGIKPNILLIIADDMGKDATAGFAEGSVKPLTPHIDAIRDEGLSFSNMWVYPTCSPTRASIITGKYGYRTGVKWASDELSASENILQNYIAQQTSDAYSTAIIGKWHLSGNNQTANPESFGLDHYEGLIRGTVDDYYQWQLTADGAVSTAGVYITKSFTDRSIDWVNEQTKPWFLWLAYTAPHTPFHVPPNVMHSQGALPDYADGMDATPYYMAAIEAMDFQIGRLLEGIPQDELENTIIIFVGDNGSPAQVAQAPYSSSTVKGSLYQGGLNVPMYITGEGVSRTGVDASLITSTDLYSTIASIAGVSVTDVNDSKSFRSLLSSEGAHRDFQYSEMDSGTSDIWTISDGSYKIIVNANGNQEMYNLVADPYETSDLLTGTLSDEATAAKLQLEAELGVIRD